MKKFTRSFLSVVSSFVLIAAMVLTLTACQAAESSSGSLSSSAVSSSGASQLTDGSVIGKGAKSFTLEVTFSDQTKKTVTVNTDADTVGKALSELGVIAGADGLYDTVGGVTLDYNATKEYWAFFVNGAYASNGMDDTQIDSGATYGLVASK